MMSKHTPGPWKVDTQIESPCHCIVVAPTSSRWIASIGDRPLGEEGQSNARLIAAAPELLEALEACERRLRRVNNSFGHEEWKEVKQAQSALKKARGG